MAFRNFKTSTPALFALLGWAALASLVGCGGSPKAAAAPTHAPDSMLFIAGEADPVAGLGPLQDPALVYEALSFTPVGSANAARLGLVSRAFAQQVYYADTRRRMGEWDDAVRALSGAMALVRTGEAEHLALAPATRTSLAAFADAFARAGREGEALGCYLWLSRPGDPQINHDAAEHERALEIWMLGSIEQHPSSWDSAQARARVHAWYPSWTTLNEADTALSNWISVLREAGSRLGRGSSGELRSLQTGMRDVGVELAALYLRDGDARGAADALERADNKNGREVAKVLRAYAAAPGEKTVGPLLGLLAMQENQEPALYTRVAPLTALMRLFVSLNGKTAQPVVGATLSALDLFRLSYVAPALPHRAAPRPDARAAAAMLLQEVATRELGAEDTARADRALNDADAFLHEGAPDLEDNGALRMLTFLRGNTRSLEGDYKSAEGLLRALLPIPPKEPGRIEYAASLEGLSRDKEALGVLGQTSSNPTSREFFFFELSQARLGALTSAEGSNKGVRASFTSLCAKESKGDSARVRALRCASIQAAIGLPISKIAVVDGAPGAAHAEARMLAHELAAVDVFTGKPDGMATIRAAIEQGVSANELVYPALWSLSALPGSGAGRADRTWLTSHVFAPAEQDPRWRGRVATYARTGDLAALRASARGKLEVAETDFYEGLAKHRAGDKAGAEAAWKRVVAPRPVGLQEYEFAIWFLRLHP